MAEGNTRLIAFFGSEAQRRVYVRSRGLDDKSVILARPGIFQGRTGPLEIVYCSGAGLSPRESAMLHREIHIINQYRTEKIR